MNNLRSLSFATFAAFTVLTAPPSARGAFITGTITGQVTEPAIAVPGIIFGSPVTGSYTYDDSRTIDPIVGPANPLTAFSLTIGTNPRVFTLADLASDVSNAPGRVLADSTPTADSLFFFFTFPVIDAYVGANVTQQTITRSPIPSQSFRISSDTQGHSFLIDFSAIHSAAAVPEPSTFTLLGLGCVALAGCAWRSRGRSSD